MIYFDVIAEAQLNGIELEQLLQSDEWNQSNSQYSELSIENHEQEWAMITYHLHQ